MPPQDLDDLVGSISGDRSPRHHVVIIDDDQGIREALTFLLGDRYDLSVCSSAQQGVDAVRDDTCAVVVDIKMSGHDGFWACNEIRKKVPDMPVIFYSAYQDVKDPLAIINEHRPFSYCFKGDSSQKLVDMVDVAVRLQSITVSNRKLIETLRRSQRRER